jgi:two-component system phosphate regulon sensor histidine kinase PhoR
VVLSLRTRLVLTHALVLVVSLALVSVLGYFEHRRWGINRTAAALTGAAREVAAELPGLGDWKGLADTLAARLGYRVSLIAADGTVLGDSEVSRSGLRGVENHANRLEVRAALAGAVGRDVRHSRTIGRDLVYVAVPARPGTAVAAVRLAEPVAVLGRSLVHIALFAALVSLVLSVPLVLRVAGGHAGRIRELEEVTRRLGRGDLDARALEQPVDALGRLGAAINHMAAESRMRLESLERERDERERILAHMSDGVALIDAAGRLVRTNRSLAELLGLALPADPGTPFRAYIRSPELDDLIRAARAQGRTVETELRLWTPGQRYVRATATPLGAPKPEAVLLVVHDLSESERLQRVRQDFVANVSHELRTPLTSLRGYAETLLQGGLEDVERREQFVRVIRDQALRLEALAEDLLSLAALERPGAHLETETFDLRAVVERQITVFRPRAAAARLLLTLQPGPAVKVTADRARIEQVIANLLDNAIKYTERGRIEVSLGEEGWRVWCEVSDTGSGISEEEQSRVFERFYRVDKARSRAKGGTGLGLSIVKHIVSLHGGEVSVKSRRGEGSVFRFEIPRHQAAPARV